MTTTQRYIDYLEQALREAKAPGDMFQPDLSRSLRSARMAIQMASPPVPFMSCPKCNLRETVDYRSGGPHFEHMRRCSDCEISWEDEREWSILREHHHPEDKTQ